VLGLGNPGRRYAGTRHNVAWEVLDELAGRWHAAPGAATPVFTTRRAEVDAGTVVLMQPLTFMNLAGEALNAWRDAEPVGDDALLVVTDDVYLPVGALRLRSRGSSGARPFTSAAKRS